MRSTAIERAAAVFLAVEAVGVAALVGWEGLALVLGDAQSVPSAIALLVLTLIGVVAVAAFAVAVWRGNSWGRSGGVVTQLLILTVAGGALTGETAQPVTAALIAAPAVLGLVLLISAARRAALRPRTEPDAEEVAPAE